MVGCVFVENKTRIEMNFPKANNASSLMRKFILATISTGLNEHRVYSTSGKPEQNSKSLKVKT